VQHDASRAHFAVGMATSKVVRRRRGWWDHPSPRCDPSETYRDIARTTERVLRGRRFGRELYWRYSVIWHRPASESTAAE
jgi:hypothetical protein